MSRMPGLPPCRRATSPTSFTSNAIGSMRQLAQNVAVIFHQPPRHDRLPLKCGVVRRDAKTIRGLGQKTVSPCSTWSFDRASIARTRPAELPTLVILSAIMAIHPF